MTGRVLTGLFAMGGNACAAHPCVCSCVDDETGQPAPFYRKVMEVDDVEKAEDGTLRIVVHTTEVTTQACMP